MSRGVTAKTPEKVAEAIRLRGEGWTYQEIADQLGVSLKTAFTWISDPDGEKLRARKDSYRGECATCGGPTDGSRGRRRAAPTLCADCARWDREAMIAAVDDFFAEHSRSPTCTDVRHGRGRLPHLKTVIREFDTWNGLLLAAGLPLNIDRRPETQAEMEQMIRDGFSAQEIADQFGWTASNVHLRLRTRGLRFSDLANKAAA